MAYDRKEMTYHLNILHATPNEISRQQQICRDRLAEIDAEERKGIWGKVTLNKRREEARAERDRVCHGLAHRMRDSLEYVKAHNNFSDTETIDFENPKLQSALKTIDYMGKDLSFADQAAILNKFRGDIGALRVIEKAFAKNGLYMKTAAKELQRTIPQQAIDEMSYVLGAHDWAEKNGRFEFPIEKAYWTKGEFGKQLERLSLDPADAEDPYSAVLDVAAESIRSDYDEIQFSNAGDEEKAMAKAKADAQLLRLNLAKREMKEAQARGENPATVLNRELSKIETASAAATSATAGA